MEGLKIIKEDPMPQYVDGFVIPIKKKNVKAYKKMATMGRNTWMKHGAVSYYETIGAKLDQKWGVNFKKLLKLKKDETTIFAWVVYKSKSHRNSVNKKVHAEFAAMEMEQMKMPFDMKRMTSGEFAVIVKA